MHHKQKAQKIKSWPHLKKQESPILFHFLATFYQFCLSILSINFYLSIYFDLAIEMSPALCPIQEPDPESTEK